MLKKTSENYWMWIVWDKITIQIKTLSIQDSFTVHVMFEIKITQGYVQGDLYKCSGDIKPVIWE